MKTLVTPAQQGLDTLRFVPANLQKLFLAGLISSDAWFLGLQLIAKMRRDGRVQTTMTMEESASTYVCLDGKPYAGGVSLRDHLYPICAMQELHCYAGLFSHYAESALREPEVADKHFTNDPFITFGDQWNLSTPIVFLFDYKNMDHWAATARNAIDSVEETRDRLDLSSGE